MTKSQKILLVVNAAYIVPAALYFLWLGNWEFMMYVLQMIALVALLVGTIHKTQFPMSILLGLSLWGFLHMAGGCIPYNDSVIYTMPIWYLFDVGDTYIIKYDQVVHAFGFFMSTLVVGHLLVRGGLPITSRKTLAFVAMLGGMGLGALNEVIEFFLVVFLPETGVGGYFNTGLDLVFNMLGAGIAALILAFKQDTRG